MFGVENRMMEDGDGNEGWGMRGMRNGGEIGGKQSRLSAEHVQETEPAVYVTRIQAYMRAATQGTVQRSELHLHRRVTAQKSPFCGWMVESE